MAAAVRLEVAGTLHAARLAIAGGGITCNLGGGTHHAHFDFGAGFNPFNDLALAALTVLREQLARRVLIVDLDVHQGDGTAAILANEPRAKTFSMHSARAFPVRKQKSTVDVELANGTGDDEYLQLLRDRLPTLLDVQGTDLVLYDAGVDVHEDDAVKGFCRGHLALTSEGLRKRDEYVFQECVDRGIPVASVIGGGYSSDIEELVQRHAIHAEVAVAVVAGQPDRSLEKSM